MKQKEEGKRLTFERVNKVIQDGKIDVIEYKNVDEKTTGDAAYFRLKQRWYDYAHRARFKTLPQTGGLAITFSDMLFYIVTAKKRTRNETKADGKDI